MKTIKVMYIKRDTMMSAIGRSKVQEWIWHHYNSFSKHCFRIRSKSCISKPSKD